MVSRIGTAAKGGTLMGTARFRQSAMLVAVMATVTGSLWLFTPGATAAHKACLALLSPSQVNAILGPTKVYAGENRLKCNYLARGKCNVIIEIGPLLLFDRIKRAFPGPERPLGAMGDAAYSYDVTYHGQTRGVVFRKGRHVVHLTCPIMEGTGRSLLSMSALARLGRAMAARM